MGLDWTESTRINKTISCFNEHTLTHTNINPISIDLLASARETSRRVQTVAITTSVIHSTLVKICQKQISSSIKTSDIR